MPILELKRRTDLSYVTLQNLYHEKTSGVTFYTIDRICKSLECNTGDLLEYVEEVEWLYKMYPKHTDINAFLKGKGIPYVPGI
jgi:DNA-binding Xre family transcriptional regulator